MLAAAGTFSLSLLSSRGEAGRDASKAEGRERAEGDDTRAAEDITNELMGSNTA